MASLEGLKNVDWATLLQIIGTIGPAIPVPGAALIGQAGALAGAFLKAESERSGKDPVEILDGIGVKADAVTARALIRMAELQAEIAAGSPGEVSAPANDTTEGP